MNPVHAPSGNGHLSPAAGPDNRRLHSLDALRACALLLGVVLHASLSYLPTNEADWAILDRSGSPWFSAAVFVIHSFRLQLFFLMAGFFARLMWKRRGPVRFIANRTLRILVPFVVGWMVVFPLLAYVWMWGAMSSVAAQSGEPVPGGFRLLRVAMDMARGMRLSDPGFPLTHLWFLYYLLLLYGVILGARAVFVGLLDRGGAWRARIDTVFGRLVQSAWALPVFVAVVGVVLHGMKTLVVDTPDRGFQVKWVVLTLYGLVFVAGWLLHRQPGLLRVFRDRWAVHLGIALLLLLPTLILVGRVGAANPDESGALRSAYRFVYAGMMGAWIFGITGAFIRFREGENRLWRYLSDSSYWVYIVHLPVVVWLQVALAHLPYSCWIKFPMVLATATLFALATYHLFVRSTVIGWVLNGRRYPFRFLRKASGATEAASGSGEHAVR